MEITLKCRGSKYTLKGIPEAFRFARSARQCEDLLEQVSPVLIHVLGSYRWELAGDCREGYRILAWSGRDSWVETQRHSTPKKALAELFRRGGISL